MRKKLCENRISLASIFYYVNTMGEGLIISETILLNVQFSFNALLISKFASTSAKSGQRNANHRQNHNIYVRFKTPTSLYK